MKIKILALIILVISPCFTDSGSTFAQSGEGPYRCVYDFFSNCVSCTDLGDYPRAFCTTARIYAADCADISSGTLTYQWQKANHVGTFAAMSGEESNLIAITQDGVYRCLVTRNGSTSWYTGQFYIVFDKSVPSIIGGTSGTKKLCDGDIIDLFVEAEGIHEKYQWMVSDDGGLNWSDIEDSKENFYSQITPYNNSGNIYKCRVSNACGNATSEKEIILDIDSLPDVSLGPDINVCEGDSHILDPGSGYITYQWGTGEDTQMLEVSDSGNYIISVTDINDCMNSDTMMVILDPRIDSVILGNDTIICLGESVLLDAGPGYDQYTWNTDSTGQTQQVSETDTFIVSVKTDTSVCISRDTFRLTVSEPFSDDNICLVTIDQATGNNLIIWEKTADAGILTYHIYRETEFINQYELVGSKSSDELSIYLDEEVNPDTRPYLYKITATDTCGNETEIAESPYHKPIFLQYNSAVGGINLSWKEYKIENQDISFKTYKIYRGGDSTSLEEIAQVSASIDVYTDTDPNSLKYKYYYRVAGVLTDACYPSLSKKADPGPYSHSLSNLENNRLSNEAINHSPADIMLASITVPEGEPEYTLIGRFTTFDYDTLDRHSYSLVPGPGDTDNSSFAISGDSLLSNDIFDFETKSTYSIRVKTTDDGLDNLSYEKSFSIIVSDQAETGMSRQIRKELKIYPNPMTHSAIIEFENPEGSAYQVQINDITGKLVYSEANVTTDRIEINRNHLPGGYYFIQLKGNKLYRGVVVIE